MQEGANQRYSTRLQMQLARKALRQYDFGQARPLLHPLQTQAVTNAVFQVRLLPGMSDDTPGATDMFALRLHEPGRYSTTVIDEELRWLQAIRRDTDLVVPDPVPTCDGRLVQEVVSSRHTHVWQCALFRWVSGQFLDAALTPKQLHRVGGFMAKLHHHAAQWVASLAVPPARRALFCDLPGWIDDPSPAARLLPARALRMLADAARQIAQTWQQMHALPGAVGFIHADLHQWNYLFRYDEVRAIDFDDCGWGPYVYDMAVTLSYFEARPDFAALHEAFVAGYQSVKPLPPGYEDFLDACLTARLFVILEWMLGWPHSVDVPWNIDYPRHVVSRLRRFLAGEKLLQA